MINWMKRVWQSLSALRRFTRFTALPFSIILPLLGAGTVSFLLTSYQMLGLVGVAIAFHIFAYVLNDVVDLSVDRTEPLRADYPLVQGTIRPWQALTIALFQIPLALIFTYWLQASNVAYTALIAAFVLMTVYDIWGKRTTFPLFTDVIQGLGWGCLAIYGAMVFPDRPSALINVILVFVVVFTMMINGVHGSLRDLDNDLNCGVCTTAILLNVRPTDTGGLVIPLRFRLYALSLQVLLVSIILLPLAYNWFGYKLMTWSVIMSILLIFILLSLILLNISATSTSNRIRMIFVGTLHIIITLSSLLILFAPYLGSGLLRVLLVLYFLPLCSSKILWDWLMRSINKSKGIHFGNKAIKL